MTRVRVSSPQPRVTGSVTTVAAVGIAGQLSGRKKISTLRAEKKPFHESLIGDFDQAAPLMNPGERRSLCNHNLASRVADRLQTLALHEPYCVSSYRRDPLNGFHPQYVAAQ